MKKQRLKWSKKSVKRTLQRQWVRKTSKSLVSKSILLELFQLFLVTRSLSRAMKNNVIVLNYANCFVNIRTSLMAERLALLARRVRPSRRLSIAANENPIANHANQIAMPGQSNQASSITTRRNSLLNLSGAPGQQIPAADPEFIQWLNNSVNAVNAVNADSEEGKIYIRTYGTYRG